MQTITHQLNPEAGTMHFSKGSTPEPEGPPRKKIYISGKITGLHPDEYTKYFTMAEAELIGKGYDVVNPLAIAQPGNDGSWEAYLLNDIKELFRCDAIYMLSNWPSSRGARIERSIAIEMGMTIMYEDGLRATTL